jgi:hypothetical protein
MVAVCTGINEVITGQANYYVFPNPTNGVLTINSVRTNGDVQILVIDGLGKLVQKHNLNYSSGNSAHTLDISELATGMYFIKLIPNEGRPELIKIIKE